MGGSKVLMWTNMLPPEFASHWTMANRANPRLSLLLLVKFMCVWRRNVAITIKGLSLNNICLAKSNKYGYYTRLHP